MAVKSMTGFGTGTARSKGVRVSVELSSVNRKQLDTVLRLPPQLAGFEAQVQKIVQEHLSRGRISGSVQIDSPAADVAVSVDQKHAAAVVETLRASANKLKLEDNLGASVLLEIPGLLKVQAAEMDSEAVFQTLEKALRSALKKLVAMRTREGRALEADLSARLELLNAILKAVKALAPEVAARCREKLLKGLGKAGLQNLAKDERVYKEIALFGEKADISEEVTRLESHIVQFKKLLRSREPAGRTLDFLAQEFFREINTVGSKANDLRITEQVVAFKTELERIREQIQNIE